MKQMFKSVPVITLLGGLSITVYAYDSMLAEQILNTVTGQMNQQFFVNKPCKVDVLPVLEMLAKKEKITLLDIRTPEEHNVIAINHPQAMFIPMNELFKKENLDLLPKDGKIIVVCHVGTRASGVADLLKLIGFKNVVYLKGGLVDLITNLTPKTAPSL